MIGGFADWAVNRATEETETNKTRNVILEALSANFMNCNCIFRARYIDFAYYQSRQMP
jgi:hypothetical protein